MSTRWGYACVSHDPPLLCREDQINHGRDALAEALSKYRMGQWPRYEASPGYTLPAPIVDDGEPNSDGQALFLDDHPRCRVAIFNEYGDCWFTDDGLLRVSGPDERTHMKRPPGLEGQRKVNLIPGVYPPEGEVRCTCLSPTLAVTHPELSPRNGWVRCTTCGGTSLPSERE